MKNMTRYLGLALATLAAGASLNVNAETSNGSMYEVTVTNITKGQSFTPLLGATHTRAMSAFTVGEMASNELGTLAESGNVAPLKSLLDASPKVTSTAMTEGLLNPGETTSFTIDGQKFRGQFTLAAMLIPTNDTFLALNSVSLPKYGTRTFYAAAYDAGTEANDEIINGGGATGVAGIPADPTGNNGTGATGVTSSENNTSVHIHRGVLGDYDATGGVSDLNSSVHRWLNPVARVTVTVQ